MAARDMTRLMRNHTDHLIRRVCLHQSARVNKHVAPVEHEGVEYVAANDADGDTAFSEACRLEDWSGIVVEQVFDLGVANERQALSLGRPLRCEEQHCAEEDRGKRDARSPNAKPIHIE